jgi:hypothetical protein
LAGSQSFASICHRCTSIPLLDLSDRNTDVERWHIGSEQECSLRQKRSFEGPGALGFLSSVSLLLSPRITALSVSPICFSSSQTDWVIGALIAWAGLAYYLELGSLFPDRAGAEVSFHLHHHYSPSINLRRVRPLNGSQALLSRQVVYLEQAFRRPKYFFPATFAVSRPLLQRDDQVLMPHRESFRLPPFFSPSQLPTASVSPPPQFLDLLPRIPSPPAFANYIFKAAHYQPGEWQSKGVAVLAVRTCSVHILINACKPNKPPLSLCF